MATNGKRLYEAYCKTKGMHGHTPFDKLAPHDKKFWNDMAVALDEPSGGDPPKPPPDEPVDS